MARHVLPNRETSHHDHQRHRHQQSRNHARNEQRADGRFRGNAVDDHRQRWRNDRTDRRRCRGDRTGSLGVVALFFHRRDFDGAESRGVGDGGTAHAGEDDRANDVRLT